MKGEMKGEIQGELRAKLEEKSRAELGEKLRAKLSEKLREKLGERLGMNKRRKFVFLLHVWTPPGRGSTPKFTGAGRVLAFLQRES